MVAFSKMSCDVNCEKECVSVVCKRNRKCLCKLPVEVYQPQVFGLFNTSGKCWKDIHDPTEPTSMLQNFCSGFESTAESVMEVVDDTAWEAYTGADKLTGMIADFIATVIEVLAMLDAMPKLTKRVYKELIVGLYWNLPAYEILRNTRQALGVVKRDGENVNFQPSIILGLHTVFNFLIRGTFENTFLDAKHRAMFGLGFCVSVFENIQKAGEYRDAEEQTRGDIYNRFYAGHSGGKKPLVPKATEILTVIDAPDCLQENVKDTSAIIWNSLAVGGAPAQYEYAGYHQYEPQAGGMRVKTHQESFENPEEFLRKNAKSFFGKWCDSKTFNKLASTSKDFLAITSAGERFMAIVTWILDHVMSFFGCLGTQEEYKEWMITTVGFLKLYQVESPDGSSVKFESQEQRLARFSTERTKIYAHYRRGKQLQKQLIASGAHTSVQSWFGRVMHDLEAMIIANRGSFLGTEGKVSPVVLYVSGPPGEGKSVLVDHLFHDVYAALNALPYNASVDKYSYNPNSSYFDTYNYQRVFELQDFLQARDRSIIMNEVLNVIRMGDETAYPLNVAECSAKGTLFFSSDFVYITSNVGFDQLEGLVGDVLVNANALKRRIDIHAELKRGMSPNSQGYCKDSLEFSVGNRRYSYNEFVAYVALCFLRKSSQSAMMSNVHDDDDKRIPEIKQIMCMMGESKKFETPQYKDAQVRCALCDTKKLACEDCEKYEREHGRTAGWRIGQNIVDRRTYEKHYQELYVTCGIKDCHECVLWKLRNVGHRKGSFLISGDHSRVLKQCSYEEARIDNDRVIYKPQMDKVPVEEMPPSKKLPTHEEVELNKKEEEHHLYLLKLAEEQGVTWDESIDPFEKLEPVWNFSYKDLGHIMTPTGRVVSRSGFRIEWNNFDEIFKGADKDQEYILMLYILQAIAYQMPRVDFFKKLDESLNLVWTSVVYKGGMWRHRVKNGPGYVWVVDEGKATISFLPLEDAPMCVLARIRMLFEDWILKPLQGGAKTLKKKFDDAWVWCCKKWKGFISKQVFEFIVGAKNQFIDGLKTMLGGMKKILAGVFLILTSLCAGRCLLRWFRNSWNKAEEKLEWEESDMVIPIPPMVKQTIPARSGAEHEFQPVKKSSYRRVPPPRKPMARSMRPEADLSLIDIVNNLSKSIAKVSTEAGNCHALAVGPRTIVVPLHLIPDHGTWFSLSFPWLDTVLIHFSEVDVIMCPENHVAYIDVSEARGLKGVRQFPTNINAFIRDSDIERVESEGELVLFDANFTHIKRMMVIRLAPFDAITMEGVPDAFLPITHGWSYQSNTSQGDCGSPLLAKVAGTWKIIGVHIAGLDKKGAAALLTQEWVKDAFGMQEYEPQSKMDDFLIDTSVVCPMEIVARLDEPLAFMPRVTKLRHTPLADGDFLTAPAPLKGDFDGLTPLQISLRKNFFSYKAVSQGALDEGQAYVFSFYRPLPLTAKDLISYEEVVFGVDGNSRLKGFDSKAGVGFPWTQTHGNRKNLINKEERWIHPDLLEACYQVEEALVNNEFIDMKVLDFLKDERLPLAKVALGKTRVFSILPIHMNMVLKRYFGRFSEFVMTRQRVAPVKVGMSLNRFDVTALFDYCGLSGDRYLYLCGDMAASDRCIPYEVFYLITESVNEWYDDEFADQRLRLTSLVFQCERVADTLVYRLSTGMPSGSYLTALYNSLAYAIMLSQMCYDGLHSFRGVRVATFGDDHIVALEKAIEPTMEKLQPIDWFGKYGMVYTDASKGHDLAMVEACDVTFLKRKFAYLGGTPVMRMNLSDVAESLKWYRKTSETRTWSTRALVTALTEGAAIEVALHGRMEYAIFWQKFAPAMHDEGVPVLSYNRAWRQYYGDFDPLLEPQMEKNLAQPPVPLNTEESVIGAGTHSQHVESLTVFEDLGIQNHVVCNPELGGVVDAGFEWPATACKDVERNVLVTQYNLRASAMKTGYEFLWNPGTDMWRNLSWRMMLRNAAFIRYNLHIEARVTATKFHYGVIWVVPHLNGRSVGVDANPWYNIYSASMLPKIELLLTSSNVGSCDVNWHMAAQYIEVSRLMDVSRQLCLIGLYYPTPIMPLDATPPVMTLIIRMKNVRLFGYQQNVSMTPAIREELPRSDEQPGVMISANVSEFVDVDLDLLPQMNESQDFTGPISGYFGTALRISKAIVSVISFFGSALQRLGLSKPRPKDRPLISSETFMPTAQSIGLSPAVTLAMDVDNHLQVMPGASDGVIGELSAILTYIKTVVLANPLTQIHSFCGPAAANVANREIYHTPASYMLMGARMWRAGCRLRLQFCASAFVAAKFHVSMGCRVSSVGDYMHVPGVMVDVSGDTEITLDCPYMSEYPFLNTTTSDPFWYKIVPLSPVISRDAGTAPQIILVVSLSFPGLQFQGYKIDFGSKETDGVLCILKQANVDLPKVSGVPDPIQAKMMSGDIPHTVYHIMKRFGAARRAPINGCLDVFQLRWTTVGGRRLLPLTNLTRFAAMFCYYRGSIDVLLSDFDSMAVMAVAPTLHKKEEIVDGMKLATVGPYVTTYSRVVNVPWHGYSSHESLWKTKKDVSQIWIQGFQGYSECAGDDFQMFIWCGVPKTAVISYLEYINISD